MSLKDKKILLAVSASIAAYKTPDLVRKLIKSGAEVQVITTTAAADFVSVLSLATVSKKAVFSDVSDHNQWNNHVELGRWADLMLVAPCSANTLSKMANGLCDNIVQAVYLSATCPILIAPAMDADMWLHPSTQKNLETVQSFGNRILPPEHGELASGLIGTGRMADPETIVTYLESYFEKKRLLQNKVKRALITAGPTYEKIDPVRFIGNYSTGKMGISFAKALAEIGVKVDLVLGPTTLSVQNDNITIHRVETAIEMFDQCQLLFPEVDMAIMTAAVADFRPANKADQKIKKQEGQDNMQIELVKNPDILASLGNQKKDQIVIGFALETDNELENSKIKLKKKKADYIVLNSLNDKDAGFGKDTNKVSVISESEVFDVPLQSKDEVAKSVLEYIFSK
ncbi:MAG TPA: bifunctional phosphopantothenoylcysteine decarboxylase/phosphopantothenate--cysteine ligase CoaBC [Edaphocola sp.]|nr:bifunctional phosphopantothenoylcysteine decarboxylase/phosphopantothenate--cysteine ligase CoaBC [Edaphocola sp.]